MGTQKNDAKEAVKAYLNQRAAMDNQFAVTYAKRNKNIDECWNYILNEARKRGTTVCMTKEEVFGLAVHYYDEDDIVVRKVPAGYAATVQKTVPGVELTEEENAQARQRAIELYRQECVKEEALKAQERRAKALERKREQEAERQAYAPSLFDFREV